MIIRNVNRIHPKNINGQELISQHYPPIGMELINIQMKTSAHN